MSEAVHRKLTTILAADAEGYSREMERDELHTMTALRAARAVFKRLIARHQGRVANTAGDGLIAEFPSVVEAVQCAIEVQQELGSRQGQAANLRFRIGIHLGDVLVDGDDLLGEGVNLAARLQSMAEPGGVLISQQVYDQVHAKLAIGFDYLGEKRPKNYAHDVPVYRVSQQGRSGAATWFGRDNDGGARTVHVAGQTPPSDDRHDRLVRRARQAAVVLAGLLAIDLATGLPFWVQFPAIGIAVGLGLQAVPVWAGAGHGTLLLRGAVIATGLVLLNLVTWSGAFWSFWPAGAVLALAALKVAGRRSKS